MGESPFSLEKRKYPLYFWVPVYSDNRVVIHIPQGYKISELIKPFKGENDYVVYNGSCETMGGSIVCRFETTVKKSIIPPEHYTETRALYNKWVKTTRAKIILEKEGR